MKRSLFPGMILGVLAATSAAAENEPAIDFNRDIRPILSDKCFFCHGPDEHERKADLRLDTREGALADLGGYFSIVPGKPNESEFVFRITDPEDPMPPEDSHKELKPEEIELLTQWIAEGAPYSEPWAYVPPKATEAPAVQDSDWPRNELDPFVLARLESEGLKPSPDAEPVTLLRRLHFDLTGLPPAPERVQSFQQDTREFEVRWTELVEELLASPAFGERMAMYWLDLVRYADTVGYHGDQDHSISPYRDWVIQAFNENLPFDDFTRAQLAGDLLPDSTLEDKIASGYNRLLQTSHEGGVQEKEYLAIYAADRVRNVSAVWMGATVGCAQCHDHKYDPFTIRDHYTLAAFFADIDDNTHLNEERRKGLNFNTLPSPRPPEIPVYTEEEKKTLTQLEAEKATFADSVGKLRAVEKQLAELRKEPVYSEDEKTKMAQLEWEKKKIAPEAKKEEILDQRIAALRKGARRTMITAALEKPRTMRVLPRGNWLDESGEIVEPAIPEFLGILDTGERRATRLDLANWVTDPEHGVGGLTARVMANRFWYLFFGAGIARSLEDFGGQGVPPTHPELLDTLSLRFVESGWDMKALVRDLVSSRAYRQSSLASPALRERDPDNQLLARQARYRLPAEMVRDNALAVSGLLVTEVGGASAKPYQPEGYYRHLNFPTRKYQAHLDDRQWRRGLYVHWQRQFLHPMMRAMDAPSREECTASRPRSNTPNAALVLLNDPTFVEAARSFAERVIREGGANGGERLEFAFRHALSRSPDDEERRLLGQLFTKTQAEYESNPKATSELLSVGVAPVPDDLDAVELASWTAVTRAILNLSEAITRN